MKLLPVATPAQAGRVADGRADGDDVLDAFGAHGDGHRLPDQQAGGLQGGPRRHLRRVLSDGVLDDDDDEPPKMFPLPMSRTSAS